MGWVDDLGCPMSARPRNTWFSVVSAAFIATVLMPRPAGATASAELYTSAANGYGRFEARLKFAAGDGVISSFFLWKDGSEQTGTFWNELDFEKLGADCHLQTNALYGNPVGDHSRKETLAADLCNSYHVYAYEWLPESIAWFVDGAEIRRETGAVAKAYADNAPNGMQIHFNVWPGDASFGGTFNPSILPVHQFIDWVQFSPYSNGAFGAAMWREDFSGQAVPSSFLTGSWGSPKNLSTHDPNNVSLVSGYAVLSLTADNATGPGGAMPGDSGSSGGGSGSMGAGAGGVSGAATAGTSSTAGSGVSGGSDASGGAPSGNAGSTSAAGTAPGASGAAAISGAAGTSSAETSPGCGCTQAGSRGTAPGELPAGVVLLAVSISAARLRRRRP